MNGFFSPTQQFAHDIGMACPSSRFQNEMNDYLSPIRAPEPTYAEKSIISRTEHLRDLTPDHNQTYVEPMDNWGNYKPNYPGINSSKPIIKLNDVMQAIINNENACKEQQKRIEMEIAEINRKNKEVFESVKEMRIEQEKEQERIWSKTLKDGTELVGITGCNTHTHICPDYIKIKNQDNGKSIGWKD